MTVEEKYAPAVCLIMSFALGLLSYWALNESNGEACAKEHNVYECQQIWVPVEGQ